MDVQVIGVPFDGYGRPGNQTGAAAALREAGLLDALAGHAVGDGDLDLPAPDPTRHATTGLINDAALWAMTARLADQVQGAVAAGRFPLVVGGDCASLLGIVHGLARVEAAPGLLFVDGHEDTMPLDVSEDGEAANSELGLLLGITGRLLPGPVRARFTQLPTGAVAMLGQRDDAWRQAHNVASVAGLGAWSRGAAAVAADPASAGGDAAAWLAASTTGWWLHVDLDVLDPRRFAAQGLPDVPDEPGGLSWAQLSAALVAALGRPGCRGWSLVIYDPDQDPDARDAARVVHLVREVSAHLPRH